MTTPDTRASRSTRGAIVPLLAFVLLACAGALLAGCVSAGPIPDGPEYPAHKPQTAVLDIQVFRDGTVIRFTNTTARSYPAGRLWLNKWYSREFPALAVGQKREFKLREFEDQYGERFRAGGFFATRRPTKLVLAQIEVGDELLGLVVVGD